MQHGLSPSEKLRSLCGYVCVQYVCLCVHTPHLVALTNRSTTCGGVFCLPGQTRILQSLKPMAKTDSRPPTWTNLQSLPPGFLPLVILFFCCPYFPPRLNLSKSFPVASRISLSLTSLTSLTLSFPSLSLSLCASLPLSLSRCGLHRRMQLN